MAKYFYYRCVNQVDLGFMAPWGKGGPRGEGSDREDAPQIVKHSIRLRPSKGTDARGRPFHPDYIVTERPLAKQYLEVTVKKVSRPAYDPFTGRKLSARAYRKKVTTVKFQSMDPSEITQPILDRVIKKNWAPEIFEEVPTKVELPVDKALEEQLAMMGPDDDAAPDEVILPEGQPVKAKRSK